MSLETCSHDRLHARVFLTGQPCRVQQCRRPEPSVRPALEGKGTEPHKASPSSTSNSTLYSGDGCYASANRCSGMIAHDLRHLSGQTSHVNAHAASANPASRRALGMRSIDRLEPGWWVETKFRYTSCYRPCRTIPTSGITRWKRQQPRNCRPCLVVFQKHEFQRGGITLLGHAERVWVQLPNPLRNMACRVSPLAIYPPVSSPLVHL